MRIRLEPVVMQLRPNQQAIARYAVYHGTTRMFDAYLYDDGDWWCVAPGGRNVFPCKSSDGRTFNANTHDLYAFARDHAMRTCLVQVTGEEKPSTIAA